MPRSHLVGLLTAQAVHASFSTAPDATVCTGPRVPNVHHRVWVGDTCPPLQDLVSMLVATLLLNPDRLQYHSTHAWGDDTRCAEVVQCHAAFGVQHNIVDIQNTSTPFVSATSHFGLATKMAHSQCTVSDRRCFRREHVSDFIRLFAVNEEGGYYLDADSFVVDARLHAAFAACPFAMFSSVGESPYYHHVNNGAFLGRPKSAFGIAWWQHFSRWDGSLWSDHSCGRWPGRRASAQPGEVHVAPAMLVPPPFLTAPAPGRSAPPWRWRRQRKAETQGRAAALALVGGGGSRCGGSGGSDARSFDQLEGAARQRSMATATRRTRPRHAPRKRMAPRPPHRASAAVSGRGQTSAGRALAQRSTCACLSA